MAKAVGKCGLCERTRYINSVGLCKRCNSSHNSQVIKLQEKHIEQMQKEQLMHEKDNRREEELKNMLSRELELLLLEEGVLPEDELKFKVNGLITIAKQLNIDSKELFDEKKEELKRRSQAMDYKPGMEHTQT